MTQTDQPNQEVKGEESTATDAVNTTTKEITKARSQEKHVFRAYTGRIQDSGHRYSQNHGIRGRVLYGRINIGI